MTGAATEQHATLPRAAEYLETVDLADIPRALRDWSSAVHATARTSGERAVAMADARQALRARGVTADAASEYVTDAMVATVRHGETRSADAAGDTDTAPHLAAAPGIPRLAEAALRGLAGDVVRAYLPHTEAAPAAILFQYLVAFGAAVGHTAYVCVGATRHHVNECLLVVGRSARARKGDSRAVALRTVRDADPSLTVSSGLSSGEGLVHAVRDPVERPNKKGEMELADAGVADKRLLVCESEFAGPLKAMQRDGNTLSPVLRAVWDGDETIGTLTKTSPTRATGAHVSVIAHSTVADLERYLSDTDAANGLGNRFLVALVTRDKLLPSPSVVDPAVREDLVRRTRVALEAARLRREVRRTPAADKLWCDLYPNLSADRPGLLGDLLARAEAHVLRLSLLAAVLDGRGEIDVEHLKSALAVWDYCEASVRAVFAGRTGSRDADRIAAAIGPGHEMTRSAIRTSLFGDRIPAARLDEALALLGDEPGWEIRTEPTGGRAAQVVARTGAGVRS